MNHLSQRRLAQLGTVRNRSRDSGHMVSHFSLLQAPAGGTNRRHADGLRAHEQALTVRDGYISKCCTWNFERHQGAVIAILSLSVLVVLVVLVILVFLLGLVAGLQPLESTPPVQTRLNSAHPVH